MTSEKNQIYSKALYYPWIEFRDVSWLKNAVLFWDKIQTITPISIRNPYKNETALALLDEEIISPLHTDPGMPYMNAVAEDTVALFQSPEAIAAIALNDDGSLERVNFDKLPYQIEELVHVHPDKLPYAIRDFLENIEEGRKENSRWVAMERGIANLYMSVLATHICEHFHLSPVTDFSIPEKVQISTRLNGSSEIEGRRRPRFRHMHRNGFPGGSVKMAESLLIEAVLETVNIDPETPVEKIIKFRRTYDSELTKFRKEIQGLTTGVADSDSVDAIREKVKSVYKQEVKPAFSDLKKSLRSSGIRFMVETVLKVSAFSVPATSIPLVMMGVSIPQALLATAGLSLTATSILYNEDRKKALRENPFSYLMLLKKLS